MCYEINHMVFFTRKQNAREWKKADVGIYHEWKRLAWSITYDMHWKWYQELPGMWYEINHMMFMIDLTWCDMWHDVWYQDLSRTKRRELPMLYKFGAICLNRERKIADPRYTSWMYKVGMIDHKITDPRYMSWMKVVGMIDHVWYALKNDTKSCNVCDKKSDRPPCSVLRQGPSMPRRNWSIRREEPSIAITVDLRSFVTHTGLTVNIALFLLVIVTHSSSMKGPRLNFHAERELAHPKTTSFSSFLQLQYPHVRPRRVFLSWFK